MPRGVKGFFGRLAVVFSLKGRVLRGEMGVVVGAPFGRVWLALVGTNR